MRMFRHLHARCWGVWPFAAIANQVKDKEQDEVSHEFCRRMVESGKKQAAGAVDARSWTGMKLGGGGCSHPESVNVGTPIFFHDPDSARSAD